MENNEMVKTIVEDFERNNKIMEYETGRSLSPQLKRAALLQVILYWYRMKAIAENVTETEVRLILPLQKSPKDRSFNMEGVVDLIRTNDGTFMYDLKSVEKEIILGQLEQVTQQLGIYAHIWQNLNNKKVNGASVISTAVPKEISSKLEGVNLESSAEILEILKDWNPLIDVNVEKPEVELITKKFGVVVDKISGKEFSPPSLDKLKSKAKGQDRDFGSLVCRKCDGRYSCGSYKDYMAGNDGKLGDLIKLIWSEEQDQDEYLEAATAANE